MKIDFLRACVQENKNKDGKSWSWSNHALYKKYSGN